MDEVDDEKEKEADDDEKTQKFVPKREPKEHPGDGLPTKPRDIISFKWNKEMRKKTDCDTLHMLYLLQLALNLVRLRTIERNKHFKSIGRTDRYIAQLDMPQIITNLLIWHNKDKENNKFDGELVMNAPKRTVLNDIFGKIGDMRKGPAIKVYFKLKKDVTIQYTEWCESPLKQKLEIETWGVDRFCIKEKILEDCTAEEVVKVLQNKVFPDFIASQKKKGKKSNLLEIDGWQQKYVQYFIERNIGGKEVKETNTKVFATNMIKDSFEGNNKLNGHIKVILNKLLKCNVHEVLSADPQSVEKA